MAGRHRGGNEVGDGLEARPRWGRRHQGSPDEGVGEEDFGKKGAMMLP